MKRLEGKIAVITGGASGIGQASVRLFVKEGAKVVIADILDDSGDALAEECGGNAVYQHVNVIEENDIKAAIERAVKEFGRLDCLFNNAGIGGAGGPIDELPAEGWDITVAINLRSVYLGMKHAIPVMKKQGSGSIISTASIAGHRTGWGGHVYSACKAAIIHLTRTVAVEAGEFGIRVNCICPGGIVTPIFGRALGLPPEEIDNTLESLKPIFSDVQSIKRCGLPEDIASAALWLAGDDAGFVSGHALKVDGCPPDGLWAIPEVRDEVIRALGLDPAIFQR